MYMVLFIDVYSSIYIRIIYMEIQKKALPVCIYTYNFTCIMCSTYNMDMYVCSHIGIMYYRCIIPIYTFPKYIHTVKKKIIYV